MTKVGILTIIGLIFCAFQFHRSDFSGRWKLDLKKSKDLPQTFKSLDAFTMEIVQTQDSMTELRRMKGAGQAVDLPPTIYRFDGSEVYREDSLRGSKRWIKSTWTTNGQKLIVTSRVSLRQRAGEQRYTETEVWEYGKRNSLLVLITQKFENDDSTHSEERIFTRMK